MWSYHTENYVCGISFCWSFRLMVYTLQVLSFVVFLTSRIWVYCLSFYFSFLRLGSDFLVLLFVFLLFSHYFSEKTETFLDPFVIQQMLLGNMLSRSTELIISNSYFFVTYNDHEKQKFIQGNEECVSQLKLFKTHTSWKHVTCLCTFL